jgi:hypothetical protein
MPHSQLSMLPSLAANFEFALGQAPHERGGDRGVEAAAAFVRGEIAPGDKLSLWMEQRAYFLLQGSTCDSYCRLVAGRRTIRAAPVAKSAITSSGVPRSPGKIGTCRMPVPWIEKS